MMRILISSKDMYYNFDRFKNGFCNILFITGYCGSGKTTLAAKLADKYNCDYFQIDALNFYIDGYMDMEQARSIEPALYDFLNDNPDIRDNREFISYDEIIKYYPRYIMYLINWCKNHEDDAFIIEGYQLARFVDDFSIFKTHPFIIKGTSALCSCIHMIMRGIKYPEYYGSVFKYIKSSIRCVISDYGDLWELNKSLYDYAALRRR